MSKVLVTGAGGYIGRHVVGSLLKMGHEVVASDLSAEGIDRRASFCETPIFGEADGLYEKLGSPDYIIHLAWRNGFVHNSVTHMEDLSDHIRFSRAMLQSRAKGLAVMGTMHEIGYWEGAIDEHTPCSPMTQYGIAKNALRQSLLLMAKETSCCLQWLRAYYITGDDMRGNSIFSKITQAAQDGVRTFPFTRGTSCYDFIDVRRLADMIAAAGTQTAVDGIINVCTGTAVSLAERVESFIRENHFDIRLEYGAFPDRPYDSPAVWGDPEKIDRIMAQIRQQSCD